MRVLALTEASDRPELALLRGLSAAGIKLEVMGFPLPALLREFNTAQIPFHELVCRGRIDFKAILRIRRMLRCTNFDILHAFTGRTLSNATLASIGFGLTHVAYRGTMGNISRLDPAAWLTWLNPWLDCTVCVSKAVERYLLSCGIDEKRLTTIYKGHDLSWYDSLPRPDLAQFGIPARALVVGCNANMRNLKGVDILIQAAQYLPRNLPVHFLLVGELRDPELTDLAERFSEYLPFHLPGYRPDAAALMGQVQVFVMPSRRREGLPKALLEAMAQGVPAVITGIGGMPEIVRHEIEGLIVPPDDSKALGDAITRLLTNDALRATLGAQARQRIQNDFNIAHTITQTKALYERLCQCRHIIGAEDGFHA